MAIQIRATPDIWTSSAAQVVLRGLLYVSVWTSVTLAGGLLGLLWPVGDVSEPAAGAGFGMLLYGMYGLCLGAGIGLIAVGSLAEALSARRLARKDRTGPG